MEVPCLVGVNAQEMENGFRRAGSGDSRQGESLYQEYHCKPDASSHLRTVGGFMGQDGLSVPPVKKVKTCSRLKEYW